MKCINLYNRILKWNKKIKVFKNMSVRKLNISKNQYLHKYVFNE